MASNAITPSGREPRRKTLDEIRREIAAEFSVPGERDFDEETTVIPERRSVPAPDRARRWHGYVMAGAIGCIIGQLVVLASFAVTRYRDEIVHFRAALSRPWVSAPVRRADETAAQAPAAPASTAVPAPAAPASAPTAPASPSASPPEVTGRAPATVPDPAAAVDPPASTPAPVPSVAIEREIPKPPPIAMRQPPPVTPPAPRVPLPGPIDWAESQAALRSALLEWIAMSSRADVQAHAAEAEVILGADGWTAKTRVPMTSRVGTVVREQRWELSAKGWSLVDDREIDGLRR